MIESICYQGILLCHQMLLFYVLGSTSYGLIGAVFSFIYLSIALLNGGFDDSIGSFFFLVSASKIHAKRILVPQLALELGCLLVYATGVAYYGPVLASFLKLPDLSQSLCMLIGAIIVVEGLKKTLRALLHVAFMHKATTAVELTSIIVYSAIVWSCYALNIPLTIPVLCVPLFICGLLSIFFLSIIFINWYQRLPVDSSISLPPGLYKRIFKNRFFIYLIHLHHQFFSANFLVPLFTVQCGLHQAGILKLTSHILHTINTLMSKITGTTITALLAHHKTSDLAQKQHAFYRMTGYLHNTLYVIIIFTFINYKKLFYPVNAFKTAHDWYLVLFFLIIHLSEHFFTIYEKFYIIEERSEYIALLNGSSTLFMYLILCYDFHTPIILLACMIALRCIHFIMLQVLSLYIWKLHPDFAIQPWYVAASAVFSMTFFYFK